MRLEEVIGARIAANRDGRMTQAEFGERVGRYLGKTWSRQTVSAAEKGGRAFTALELIVISTVLDIPMGVLFLPRTAAGTAELETPGGVPLPVESVINHVSMGVAVSEPMHDPAELFEAPNAILEQRRRTKALELAIQLHAAYLRAGNGHGTVTASFERDDVVKAAERFAEYLRGDS